MRERWALVFGPRDGVNGRFRLLRTADRASYWAYLDLRDEGVVIVRDDELAPPRGSLVEVRGDALWAEAVCEVPGEHWSFGLEAFGLLLADLDEARTVTVGDRVPVGFDLEWDEGLVVGELLVGKRRIAVETRGDFAHTTVDETRPDAAWPDESWPNESWEAWVGSA
jgi:hypothetical protein